MVGSLHTFAELQRTTSRGTTSPNICWSGLEPFMCYILQMLKPFCRRTSRVSCLTVPTQRTSGSGRLINWLDYGFGARPDIFAPLLGSGIFTQEGFAWKHSRQLLRKQFIRVQYQTLDHFAEHVDNLINRLPSNGLVDLQPLFFDMTLDTATALLFGRSVYALRAGIDQHNENKLFAESFHIAQEGLAKRFRIAPWHFLYNPRSFRQACANVHRFVEEFIKSLDLGNVKTDDNRRLGFIKQVAEESASVKDLRDQLLNVLLAGRDTTACCLSWTLYVCLSRSPIQY